ncbi:heme/copper-type cytochrome/quinol oxidase subunit 2 [Microbacterium trichothecenolyticum]|uniref:PLD nuclease N-terminal domain-containing protein n=1 Tax=Microbacterium trichothecenolyticum TaxID=69370 RepID=UPI0028642E52|nr:PLD nuclease N-terminal domain-containing protein [Microbacterium trichothecenolyticum]MDR7112942.1 heme/copper-type cytochrome/quinol oxidase subunit 2 [Microbacterium trichothecenolyticum]
MAASQNPLIPAWYDIVWSGIAVLVLALSVIAVVSISRSSTQLTSRQALGWTLLVIFVPVIGAFAWFAIGRRSPATSSECAARPGRRSAGARLPRPLSETRDRADDRPTLAGHVL